MNDQQRAALLALAEPYAQRLWEGEFAPDPEIETARSKLPTRSGRRRVVAPPPFLSNSPHLPPEPRSTDEVRLPVEPKIPGDNSPNAEAAKSGKQTPEPLVVAGVRNAIVPLKKSSSDDSPTTLQHVLMKWTGSRRRQARQIVARFPRRIDTYYEPFLGGGSILYELLGSDIEVGRYEVSDICKPLVDLWQMVRFDPTGLVEEYTQHWIRLQSGGASYYTRVRGEFNERNDPHLFFFLLRTCRNGVVKFNEDGRFYSKFHRYRPSMNPDTIAPIVQDWSDRLAAKDVHFSLRNYRELSAAQEGDLLYLDPPYCNEYNKYYVSSFDVDRFFVWLRTQPCGYLLSHTGYLGDSKGDIPTDLFDEHILMNNGISPFEQLDDDDAKPVTDSLYIRLRSSQGTG